MKYHFAYIIFIHRLLPMNFTNDDMSTTILRDRTRAGASMADIDPMDVDRSVTFGSIGGLGKHLRKLKEMIVFPLMYPEVFDKFKIAPPRGVLFYGPPGILTPSRFVHFRVKCSIIYPSFVCSFIVYQLELDDTKYSWKHHQHNLEKKYHTLEKS